MSMQSAQWITTARVLRRSGFGTTGADVDSFLAAGDISASVGSMLKEPFADDPGVLATPIPDFGTSLRKPAAEDDQTDFIVKLRQQSRELTCWWLRRMLAVEHPVSEKMTFLWHNHFATSANPVRSASLMAKQNATIRELCLRDFRSLAYAMLTDGAMLKWLSGTVNTAKSPNENLAREFMELFALGHGNGYTEVDVREAARALTGWVVDPDESIRFDLSRHDGKTKTVLGVKGNHDASSFCRIVLEQTGSARFIASRLWIQLAAEYPPTPETLDRLVAAYGRGRDLKALTLAILTDPEFLDGRSTLINGPVDWFVGLLRVLHVSLKDPQRNWEYALRLKSLGQLPFYPPNVGGWPRGQAWLSTATASLRISAATTAVEDGDISSVTDAPVSERIDSVGYLLGIGSWSDRSVKTLSSYTGDPAALVVAAANTPEYLTT